MSEIKITVPTLGASWIPKLFGLLGSLIAAAKLYGVHIGHIGQGDYVDFAGVLITAAFAWSVKQSNVHGGTVGQPSSPEARAAVNQDASSVKKGA